MSNTIYNAYVSAEENGNIMCINMKGNWLGCSYYASSSVELFLMEDTTEPSSSTFTQTYGFTTTLITQIAPKLIIVPDSLSDTLYTFLEKEYGTTIELKRVMTKEFLFEKGRAMLLNWHMRRMEETASRSKRTQNQNSNYSMAPSIASGEPSLVDHSIFLRDPEEGNKSHAYLNLEGLLQLDQSHLTIGCAGVLLKHLQKIEQEQALINTKNEDGQEARQQELSIQPTIIRVFSSEMSVQLGSDTISSLCIFNTETHPNMHQQQDSHKKESLSLFGLLDKTHSVIGKQMLREWVARPTRDTNLLSQRHAAIHMLLNGASTSGNDEHHHLTELAQCLKHIKNIYRLLAKLRESKKTSSNDWQYILKFAYYSICILGVLNQQFCTATEYHNVSFIRKVKEMLPKTDVMKQIGSYIDNIIDFEESKNEGRIIVKEGVSPELDRLRETYEQLDDYLLQVSQEISAELPVGLGATLNVVYFPQLGYLVTLPQHHLQRRDSASLVPLSDYYQQALNGFQLQFTTGDNLYYKNDRTKELDENLGDIHAMMADKEIEIIHELAKKVLSYTKTFFAIAEVLAELDCLISLSLVALKFNYVQPVMTKDDSLVILKGRHPLQELCVNIFIPNNTCIKGGLGFRSQREEGRAYESTRSSCSNFSQRQPQRLSLSQLYSNTGPPSIISTSTSGKGSEKQNSMAMNSVQIVTGANFSGKSVYLKQVALIVYMAHIGSFLPAEKAIIGVIDKFFTRIQTSETVSKPQSAFGYDLQQLNRALHNATEHSLIIIDEFGKGTDSSDGAALFCSVIGYFLSKGNQCPKIIASTHFHDLIGKNYLSAEDGITLSHTEIIVHDIAKTAPSVVSGPQLYDPKRTDKKREGNGNGSSSFITRNFWKDSSCTGNKSTTSATEEPAAIKGDEVIFLYKIIPTESKPQHQEVNNRSHGTWCASIAGLPTHTVQRAVELSELYSQGASIRRLQLQQEKAFYKRLEAIQSEFLRKNINEVNPLMLIASVESLLEGDD